MLNMQDSRVDHSECEWLLVTVHTVYLIADVNTCESYWLYVTCMLYTVNSRLIVHQGCDSTYTVNSRRLMVHQGCDSTYTVNSRRLNQM